MLRYLIAALVPALILPALMLLHSSLGQMPGTAFLAGILLCARFAGFGPGVVATLLSAGLLAFFLLPPVEGVDASGRHLPSLVMFVAVGLLTAWLAQRGRLD